MSEENVKVVKRFGEPLNYHKILNLSDYEDKYENEILDESEREVKELVQASTFPDKEKAKYDDLVNNAKQALSSHEIAYVNFAGYQIHNRLKTLGRLNEKFTSAAQILSDNKDIIDDSMYKPLKIDPNLAYLAKLNQSRDSLLSSSFEENSSKNKDLESNNTSKSDLSLLIQKSKTSYCKDVYNRNVLEIPPSFQRNKNLRKRSENYSYIVVADWSLSSNSNFDLRIGDAIIQCDELIYSKLKSSINEEDNDSDESK
jgi:hypothetical protein